MLIDYDDIQTWGPSLSDALSDSVPALARERIEARKFEFIEDACSFLFRIESRDQIIADCLDWISENQIAAYHGSRLQPEEMDSIKREGLVPLDSTNRRKRIHRALNRHPKWNSAKHRLDDEIWNHGPGEAAGYREGQVHLTLSRTGLISSFNHYLLRGSEFDQHVAYALLGTEGMAFLELDGTPTLIQAKIPGEMAIAGANPYLSQEDILRAHTPPNLAREFIESWSYWLNDRDHRTNTMQTDCGIIFHNTLKPDLIVKIEVIAIS